MAVKRLREDRPQGSELQFQTEVEMISMALHRNLLRLQGFCMTPTERLLVYPYMVNGSVASCLRGTLLLTSFTFLVKCMTSFNWGKSSYFIFLTAKLCSAAFFFIAYYSNWISRAASTIRYQPTFSKGAGVDEIQFKASVFGPDWDRISFFYFSFKISY